MKLTRFSIIFVLVLTILATAGLAITCGNGIVEGIEECDDGDQSSDTEADACRTDCTLAICGDGIRDSNEECDEGLDNDDEMPNSCRTDCQDPHCGDGVLDFAEGETCDDGNTDSDDGCYQCYDCYLPQNNLHLVRDAKLCEGSYTIKDEGEEGVIIIDADNIVVDCKDVELIGVTSPIETAGVGVNQQAMQNIVGGEEEESEEGFFSGMVMMITNFFGGSSDAEEEESNEVTGNPVVDAVSERKTGTGILVRGAGVVLLDCDVTNYMNGVRFTASNNILFNNELCGNSKDVRSTGQDNYGALNKCDNVDNFACMFDCDGNPVSETVECPVTECEECEECEEEEVPEVEEEEVEETEEVPVVEEEEVTKTGDECVDKYLAMGVSLEDAKKKCEYYEKEQVEYTKTGDECVDEYLAMGVSLEDAKTKCSYYEEEEEVPTCMDLYMKKGYTKEEAYKECYEEEETPVEVEETTGDECLDKYMATGMTKDEAYKECYEEEETPVLTTTIKTPVITTRR
ncbi:DUF4215 domain-containing protein [Thermoproteota archaeon]